MLQCRAYRAQISWFRYHFELSIKLWFSLMKTLKRGSEDSPLEEPMSSKTSGVFISQSYSYQTSSLDWPTPVQFRSHLVGTGVRGRDLPAVVNFWRFIVVFPTTYLPVEKQ